MKRRWMFLTELHGLRSFRLFAASRLPIPAMERLTIPYWSGLNAGWRKTSTSEYESTAPSIKPTTARSKKANFWSATETSSTNALEYLLYSSYAQSGRAISGKTLGFSGRCLRDWLLISINDIVKIIQTKTCFQGHDELYLQCIFLLPFKIARQNCHIN